MADVKVPSKLHLMSPSFQKRWYKKNNMEMPQERSAAAAKKIKPVEVKPAEVPVVDKPKTAREINAARQAAYYAKGGRQPIGAGGSGGSGAMAGAGQSTVKDIRAGIKAGFNPKVSLDPYESERAKKIGPRSLKMKKEEVQIDEVTGYEGVKDRTDMIKRAAVMGRMGKNVFLARVKARAAEMKKQKAMKEEVQDQADVGEYDYEGDMAKSQLRSILANAKRMHDMLEENTNLPEWVQSKITLAEDYILTAANYMEGEMNEELIRQEESIFEAMKKMEMDDEEDEMDDEEDEMDDEDEMEDDEEETKMKAKRTNESAKDWKKAFSNVAQKNLQKDVGKIRSKVGRLNYIGMQPKVDTTPKVTATMTKKGTYSEEVGGKVAVTPKEKALAAHHGDKSKITYGDVIKARLKSVAAKAMNKGK